MKNQAADRLNHWPSSDQANFGVFDLAGRGAAELPYAFQDKFQAVHIGFGHIPAAGVEWKIAIRPFQIAAGSKRFGLIGLAEAVFD